MYIKLSKIISIMCVLCVLVGSNIVSAQDNGSERLRADEDNRIAQSRHADRRATAGA